MYDTDILTDVDDQRCADYVLDIPDLRMWWVRSGMPLESYVVLNREWILEYLDRRSKVLWELNRPKS